VLSNFLLSQNSFFGARVEKMFSGTLKRGEMIKECPK
jgi:hypothetical protein